MASLRAAGARCRALAWCAAVATGGCAPAVAPHAEGPSLRVEPAAVELTGEPARRQLLVPEVVGGCGNPVSGARMSCEREIDRTRDARIVPEDERIVDVGAGGVLEPLRSGETAVVVRFGDRAV